MKFEALIMQLLMLFSISLVGVFCNIDVPQIEDHPNGYEMYGNRAPTKRVYAFTAENMKEFRKAFPNPYFKDRLNRPNK